MALAGALDSFADLKREQYFAMTNKNEPFLDTLLRYGNRYQADQAAAFNSLFGGENMVEIATPAIPQAESWSDLERLNKERELVGIYLSAHPLDDFQIILEQVCNTTMKELEDVPSLATREITMGGMVTSLRTGNSKNGNPYGIVKIEDYSGTAEIPFFGQDWVNYQGYLGERTFLYMKARCQPKRFKPEELELKITSIELLPDVKDQLLEKLTITVPLDALDKTLVMELSELTQKSPGKTELCFNIVDNGTKQAIGLKSTNTKISVSRELISFINQHEELEFRIN
jgi:DNA polymerase-3 subunit alpha